VVLIPDEKALMVTFTISISQMGFRVLSFGLSDTIQTLG